MGVIAPIGSAGVMGFAGAQGFMGFHGCIAGTAVGSAEACAVTEAFEEDCVVYLIISGTGVTVAFSGGVVFGYWSILAGGTFKVA